MPTHAPKIVAELKHKTDVARIDGLEPRMLFAAAPTLAIATTTSTLGNVLNVSGTTKDDRITITNTRAGLVLANAINGYSVLYTGSIAQIRVDGRSGNDRVQIDPNIRIETALYGGSGVDSLVGGSGNDRLYGGDGRDYLYGQGGDDVLVAIGDGSVDRLYGGSGTDSFWADSGSGELIVDGSADEIAGGRLHRVSAFMSTNVSGGGEASVSVSSRLVGGDLPDPALAGHSTGYGNFATRPLFSKLGPTSDDVFQGALGDCYLLASLGSVAATNPQVLRNMVADLGDGTYAVQFVSGSSRTYIRVDADLPVASWGLAYAGFGRQGSTWVAIIEKAYAFFRYNLGSYSSLEGGFMGDVYSHMGLGNTSLFSATSATGLLQRLEADLDDGLAVTFGTRPDCAGLPCTGGHAYVVDQVLRDGSGTVTGLRLRNPWGVDDVPGHGANDGYITVTASQALAAFWFACSAQVR